MKKIFTILLLTVMLLGLIACSGESGSGKDTSAEQTTPEQTTEQVPAPIRVLLKETTYGLDGNETYRREYEYDKNGNLVKQTEYRAGEEELCKINTYNDQNFLVRSETAYRSYPQVGGSATYEYNDQGLLIKSCTFDYRGRPKNETEYEYDELGRVVKMENRDGFTTYTYGENDSVMIIERNKEGEIWLKSENIYDAAGNSIALRSYVGDIIASEIVYEYNADNQMIKQLNYNNGELISYTVFEYQNGLQVRVVLYQDGKPVDGEGIYEYNELGEKVKYISYNAAGMATQTITYEYGSIE